MNPSDEINRLPLVLTFTDPVNIFSKFHDHLSTSVDKFVVFLVKAL